MKSPSTCRPVGHLVMLPTFNRGALIEAAVRNVLAQDDPKRGYPSLELIVVNDGSTDPRPSA